MHDWPQIHERYAPLVWGTVYRILGDHAEALDCFQDVFAEVLEHSSSRSVRDRPAFLRWMAVRRALDRLRKRRVDAKRVALDVEIATLSAIAAGPDAQAQWNELIERVREELARLPGQQAEAFWLHCVEDMSQAANWPAPGSQCQRSRRARVSGAAEAAPGTGGTQSCEARPRISLRHNHE